MISYNQWHRVISAEKKEERKIYKTKVVKFIILFNIFIVIMLLTFLVSL